MFVEHIDLTFDPGVSNANHQWGDRMLDKVQHGALGALFDQQGLECLTVCVPQQVDEIVGGL